MRAEVHARRLPGCGRRHQHGLRHGALHVGAAERRVPRRDVRSRTEHLQAVYRSRRTPTASGRAGPRLPDLRRNMRGPVCHGARWRSGRILDVAGSVSRTPRIGVLISLFSFAGIPERLDPTTIVDRTFAAGFTIRTATHRRARALRAGVPAAAGGSPSAAPIRGRREPGPLVSRRQLRVDEHWGADAARQNPEHRVDDRRLGRRRGSAHRRRRTVPGTRAAEFSRRAAATSGGCSRERVTTLSFSGRARCRSRCT